jgi:sortase A
VSQGGEGKELKKGAYQVKRVLPYILIITGLLMILVPLTGTLFYQAKQDEIYQNYLDLQENMDSGSLSASVNPDLAEDDDQVVGEEDKWRPSVIGRIKIPAIEMDLLLIEGTSAAELNWGAGHIIGSALPGAPGNCSIAGHRNYVFGSYFSRLDEVVVGNIITLNYQKTDYQYVVDEIFIVEPDDVSVLKSKAGQSTVTLITCTPKGSNTHRLIVQGHLN